MTFKPSWKLPITQKLAGVIAGCTRQGAAQGARHGYAKWLRSQYRREVIEGASKYQGDTIKERHALYVKTVCRDLSIITPVVPAKKGRGRPVNVQAWNPATLAKVLNVSLSEGDTLVDVFTRWADAQLDLVQQAVKKTVAKAKQVGRPVKECIQHILGQIWPVWANPNTSAGYGRHRYGKGWRAACAT